MELSRDDRKFVRELNGIKVPAALFREAIHAIEKLGKDYVMPEKRCGVLHDFFTEKGYEFHKVFRFSTGPFSSAVAAWA